jgi:molybdopterin/thiamine biosynthesis adenylyltransferase
MLVDGDRVRPGNVVRHLAVDGDVGMSKVAAVKKRLLEYRLSRDADIRTLASGLDTLEQAELFLTQYDIVIDATASATATNLLALVAETQTQSLISCSIMREGALVRVDRWPLKKDEEHYPAISAVPEQAQWSREAGCGDPVSLITPASVVQAAVLAARLAINVLLGRSCPPTTVMVLEPQPDPPYDQFGFIP